MFRRREVRAALGSGAVATMVFLALPLFVERPFWRFGAMPRRESRAAIAIRDNVIPFQKWGSKAFTLRSLERGYGEVAYFTENAKGDKKDEFVRGLTSALERHECVDIFLLAHSNRYVDWVAEVDPALRHRIRLVYNTGCQDGRQADRWLGLGARTYVGHPGESESPVFYFFFLRRWAAGHSAGTAVDESNALLERTLVSASTLGLGVPDADAVLLETQATCFGDADATLEG